MTTVLEARPLNREAFAPFGDVIEAEGAQHFAINNGTVERYHDLARVEFDEAGRPLVSIFECVKASELPHRVALVERHTLGSQGFIPLGGAGMLVVVARPGDPPSPDQLNAFVAGPGQGVNYRPGVWHMPLIAFGTGQRFLVIDRGGPGDNCDEHYYQSEEIIVRGSREESGRPD